MTGHAWSEADRETLRRLWVAKPRLTITQIAVEMGRHRNAVLSMVGRMDLPVRIPDAEDARVKPPAKPEPPRAVPKPDFVQPPRPIPAPDRVTFPATPPHLPTPNGCQFPLWGNAPPPRPPLFCGAVLASYSDGTRAPYCAAHCAVAYAGITARKVS